MNLIFYEFIKIDNWRLLIYVNNRQLSLIDPCCKRGYALTIINQKGRLYVTYR